MSGGNDINPKIGLEYSGFKAGITELNRNIKLIESEFRAATAGMDDWKNSSEGLEAKIKSLTGKSEEHRKKLKLLEQQYKKVSSEKGSNSAAAKNLEIRINAEKEALGRNEKQLNQCKTALSGYKDGTIAADKATKEFNEKIDALNAKADKLNKFGDSMNRNVTAPILAAAAASVKFASDYNASLRTVSTIIDASVVDINDISGEVLDLSDDVNIAATKVNEGLYQMVSATGDSVNAMGNMEVASKASIGGLADLEVAVDGITTVMNTYKLVGVDAMTSVSDQMITAQNYGKTTLGAISQNIGDVISVARNMDMTTQDLFASIAALTKGGVQTGKSITGIKMALSNIIDPTAEAIEVADRLGLQFEASHLKSVGWARFIDEIGKKTGGSSEDIAKLFGSVEAYNVVTSLAVTNTDLFAEALVAMENSSGATQAAFEKMDSGEFNQFAKSLNELKNAAIEAGDSLAPLLSDLAGIISDLAKAYKELTPEGKKTVNVFLGIAASIGPLSKLTGGAIKGFTGIKKVLNKLSFTKVANGAKTFFGIMSGGTTVATGLAGTLGSLAISLLPVAAGFAVLVGLVAAQSKRMDESNKKMLEAAMTAEEFYDKLEGKEPVEKFAEEIDNATESVKKLDDTVQNVDTSIPFTVNTSVLEKAKEVVVELKTVYGDLMLALDDGKSSSDEANKAVEELGEALKTARREAIQPQINAVLDSNLSYEAQAELINEINGDYEEYGDAVDGAVKSITSYNDAMAKGPGVNAETIENFQAGQLALSELTNEADKLTDTTLNLDGQIEQLNAGIAMGTEDNGAFVLQLQELVSTMSEEAGPVIEEIIAAYDEYQTSMNNVKTETDELVLAKGTEAVENQKLANTYNALMGRYPNMSVAFTDYVAILLGQGDKLSSGRKKQAEIFGESLTAEEQQALSQLNSTEGVYNKLQVLYNEHVAAAEAAQTELEAIDPEAIIDEAQVSAYEGAIARMTTATENFNTNGETSFSTAAAALKLYFEESGIELDAGLLNMLTALAGFETNLVETTGTAGENSLDELIKPFVETGEQSGIDAVNFFTDGIQVGIDNKLAEINNAFSTMANANVDTFNTGLGNHSPSWKAQESLRHFIDGAVLGVRNNAYKLYQEIRKVADTVSAILDESWDINSPSKVGEEKTMYYMAGMEKGFAKNAKRTVAALKNGLISEVDNVSKMMQIAGERSGGKTYNDNRKTIAPSVTLQVSGGIDSFAYRQETTRILRETAASIAKGG